MELIRAVAEVIVWGCLGGLVYTYIGYPLLLAVLGLRRKQSAARQAITPTVTIVIAAWNEAVRLHARIENCLRQAYPAEKLAVMVVSDGSTDETAATVQRIADDRVTFIKLEKRQGKAAALNAGVSACDSEIIVFADARQQFAPSAVADLVANFSDAQVGAVSGELVLVSDTDQPSAEGLGWYWRMEKWIRRQEGELDSVIGVTGAIYAIRRNLFQPLPPGAILDDLLVPMRIAMEGYRVLFEPRALAFDRIETNYRQVLQRKVRTLAGNYQTISLCPDLINPKRNRLFVQFISHKVFRLASPFWLVLLLVSNSLILEGWLIHLFVLQMLGYSMALSGWALGRIGIRDRLTTAAFTFCLLNYAALLGALRYVQGAPVWDRPGAVPARSQWRPTGVQ